MKEAINLKSVSAGLVVLLIGFLLIFTWKTYGVSVGCSLIASSIVALINTLWVDRKTISPLDEWGIKNIYNTRGRMNDDTDKSLSKAKYKVDAVAFGLKSFRTEMEKETRRLLKNGVNFRIITMHPDSPFIRQREIEENDSDGQIKKAILDLIEWAEKLNRESKKGKIEIKGYSCMTLDFYWRVDDDVYIGPYWYQYPSQQTISYKFSGDDNKGFRIYTEYFDKLWINSEMKPLVPRTNAGKKK